MSYVGTLDLRRLILWFTVCCYGRFGLSSTACKFFGSFLGCRAQKVMVDGEFSDLASVEMGSSQSSVLWPLLFACLLMKFVNRFWIENFIYMRMILSCIQLTLEGMVSKIVCYGLKLIHFMSLRATDFSRFYLLKVLMRLEHGCPNRHSFDSFFISCRLFSQ
jgi:hypothetical protein